ncbi:MAG: EamA family transporter [Clostridia bacterium]|jgi:drug/metabolite transporter (DMT)-like permease|nr:EamA family transporter [Clostridia bacterium]
MIAVFYIIIITFSVIQSASVKWFNKTSDNAAAFNTIKTFSALILFGVISIWKFSFNTDAVIYGGLYGICLCMSMYCGYKALSLGPLSLTSLIVSFSVIFPLIYGIVFCRERINAVKCAGFVFLALAIVSVNISGGVSDKAKKVNNRKLKWEIFVFATFACNGLCTVLQKMHQIKYPGRYCAEFMLFAMLVCGIIFLVVGLQATKPKAYKTIKGKRYAALSGIANAAANYSTIALAGYENASVMYPAISAGTILATVIFGTVIFKERLKYNQMLALLCGIVSVICLKI